MQVPPRVAFCAATSLLLAGVTWAVLPPARPDGGAEAGGPPGKQKVLPAGSYPAAPLAVGTACPPYEAAGWINGPAPLPGAKGPRLIVLDIWAHL